MWVGPEVGSTVQWQEGGDARAPLVASVLEQFGRMTALARETTTSLLTSTAYWGAQPGQLPHCTIMFSLYCTDPSLSVAAAPVLDLLHLTWVSNLEYLLP